MRWGGGGGKRSEKRVKWGGGRKRSEMGVGEGERLWGERQGE